MDNEKGGNSSVAENKKPNENKTSEKPQKILSDSELLPLIK